VVVEKRRGASATIAWLALFLSLTTVAGVGYLLLEKYRAEGDAAQEADAVAELSGQLARTNQSLTELGASVSDLSSADDGNSSTLAALRRDLDGRGQLFDSLPPRMTKLERSVAGLQGVSADARNTYLIAEAGYYLQIANAQLQLAGNAYLASLALKQADDRLLQLGDPALTDVRRAVADELAALEVMQSPDIAGLSLTLASLAQVVDALPLRRPAGGTVAEETEDAAAQSGAGRAWDAVKGAVSGLVKHTPPGVEAAPLLTPDAEPLIRSNLALQLQAARLAMLRGEPAVFSQSLEDADTWLVTYFDADSEPVAGARATLVEVGNKYSVSAPPDISGSLRLLRQYKALVEPDE
jgi:uroporphyrin-3 C-methyltransferase